MTQISSGLTAFVQSVINSTTTQVNAQVNGPAFNPQGTPPTAATYAPLYGTAGNAWQQLVTPGSVPAQNGFMAVGATATSSGAAGSTIGGIAPQGPAQGNAQNQAATPDVYVSNVFDMIYQQLLSMAAYSYRM